MSGARPDTWMPLYWGDYLRDTGHLSPAEHGAYLLLIGHYWTTGGPISADDMRLARIARMSLREWQAIKAVIAEFFEERAGEWVHGRIDFELDKASRTLAARQKAGKEGGKRSARARANVKQTSSKPAAVLPVCNQQNPTPSPSPLRDPYPGKVQGV